MKTTINTMSDANTAWINSGMLDWAWFNDRALTDGEEAELVERIYREGSVDLGVRSFLVAKGESLIDYGLES